MLTFQEFEEQLLVEKVLNLFTAQEKEPYMQDVWDILQFSYRKINGIKGRGFNSPEDMIANIPFWKIVRKDGKVVAVAMYKDKQGRKGVAFGTDGTPTGKKAAAMMVKDAITQNREWKEVSGAAWGFTQKVLGKNVMKGKVLSIEKVRQLLPDDEIVPAFGKDKSIRSDDEFRDYYYMRELGGEWHTKIAIGSPNIELKDRRR